MSRRVRLVLAPLAAAAAGIVVGAAVMGLVLLAVRALPRDGSGWADLGLVVVGMFCAVAAGVLVWVAGLAWAARRLFDAGRRLRVVTVAVSAVFVMVIAHNALARALGEDPPSASGALMWLGALLVLAAPSVVFRLFDRRAVNP